MLKMDINLYNAVGERLVQLVGDIIGGVNRTKKSPMYLKNGLISFSYVFEENKNIYLYIKDFKGNITLEMKDWSNGRIETRDNVDMKECKDIIIDMYEKITEDINTDDIVNSLFMGKFGQNIPF